MSAGGSSHRATPLIIFAGSERADESCDASYSAEADTRPVTVSVVSLGKHWDGGCGAGAGVVGRASGMEIFGTTLVLLG